MTMKTIISTSAERAERLELDRPREDEHGLDVEHDEQQRVHVVADVRLARTPPTGSEPAS